MQVLMAASASKFERLNLYKGKNGKFIKGFLLNDIRNKNGWRTPWEGIKTYYTDFLNKPGTYFEINSTPDHPAGKSYKDMMTNQENYRVVNIIDLELDEENRTLNYVGEILDKNLTEIDFEALLDSGKINYTSPGIFPTDSKVVGTMENGREMLDVYKWRALHIAYIEDPAFGKSAAETLGTCEGMGEQCMTRLAANTELAPLQEIPLIRKKLNAMYTPCQIKDFHKQILAAAEDEKGRWVTSNGQHIFIPDGVDVADAMDAHFEKLNDKYFENEKKKEIEKKNEKPEKKDESKHSFDKITNSTEKAEKKDIQSFQGGMTKKLTGTVDTAHMEVIKKIWNDLPESNLKGIDELVLKGSISKQRNVMGGEWVYADNRLVIVSHPSFTPKDYAEIIHHEMGHKEYKTKTEAQKAAWIEYVKTNTPPTMYAKSHKDRIERYTDQWKYSRAYRQDPAQKEIIDKNIAMYTDLYFEETHSEVVSIMRSGMMEERKIYSKTSLDKAIKKYQEIF